MSLDESRRALQIFERSLELDDKDIPDFLTEACDSATLRAAVEKLIAVSKEDEAFLPSAEEAMTSMLSRTEGQSTTGSQGVVDKGDVLLSRYEIVERIGTGGVGEVYRARDERLGRDVAIKLLSRVHDSDPVMRDRFERELRLVASLVHPNVMGLFDIGDHKGTQVAVMELIEGTLLRDLMEQGLDERRSVGIALEIAAALTVAHERHLMHRDIKPENIMVTEDGRVKVLDFGLARPKYSAGDTILTQSAAIIGTFPYMSPEQSEGLELESSTDVFSLGTVLFEMLSGVNPFLGKSIFETMRRLADSAIPKLVDYDARVSARLDALLTWMLRRDPQQRPSASRIVSELQTVRHELAHPRQA